MQGNQKSIVDLKAYKFAIRIVKLYKFLVSSEKEYVLSKQILKSGTAICALVREAEHAQSRADFINKMNIALKEANETSYWIDLMHDTYYLNELEYKSIYNDCVELIKILVKIVKSSKDRA